MVSIDSGVLHIKPEGDFTIYDLESLKKAVLTEFNNTLAIELDLSMVDKMDTASLQFVVALKKLCKESHKIVSIKEPSDDVKSFLDLLSARKLFE